MLVFLHFPSKTVSFFIFRALKKQNKKTTATRVFTFLRSVAEGNITFIFFGLICQTQLSLGMLSDVTVILEKRLSIEQDKNSWL